MAVVVGGQAEHAQIPTVYTTSAADIDDGSKSEIVRLCIAAHEEQQCENLFLLLAAR